jgi:phosphate transport system permease protein
MTPSPTPQPPARKKSRYQAGSLRGATSGAEEQVSNLPRRHRIGAVWVVIFQASTIIGMVALMVLLFKVINDSFGYAIIVYSADPATFIESATPIEELTQADLIAILQENLTSGRYNTLNSITPFDQLSAAELADLVIAEVAKPKVAATYTLIESLTQKEEIIQYAIENFPGGYIEFRNWVSLDFVTSPQSSNPLVAGVRNAILGSLFTILIAMLFAVPMGIAAAVYLEEYARDNWINRLIRTNINNLAGVPSIIYGILGLAVFVRALEPFTSGTVIGFSDPTTANGRTILSAGLTLGLLVLPLVIINAQEAIRAVPRSLREASFGLGGTKWQTVWHHVLPNAIPGTLTGTILAMSRAIGETAPLVVIGASTFITYNPSSPFSKFTTLPIQIYQWTARPQDVWRNLAAAAIIILLILLLIMNSIAVILRNRYTRRLA